MVKTEHKVIINYYPPSTYNDSYVVYQSKLMKKYAGNITKKYFLDGCTFIASFDTLEEAQQINKEIEESLRHCGCEIIEE